MARDRARPVLSGRCRLCLNLMIGLYSCRLKLRQANVGEKPVNIIGPAELGSGGQQRGGAGCNGESQRCWQVPPLR